MPTCKSACQPARVKDSEREEISTTLTYKREGGGRRGRREFVRRGCQCRRAAVQDGIDDSCKLNLCDIVQSLPIRKRRGDTEDFPCPCSHQHNLPPPPPCCRLPHPLPSPSPPLPPPFIPSTSSVTASSNATALEATC